MTIDPALADLEPLAPVVFVTGKGGVGKTTVAAGLAVAAARTDSGAVFVEFNDGLSGSRALGAAGRAVERIVIDPQKAVMQAAGPLFGSSWLARLAFGNFAMKPFVAAAPAVRELAVLAVVKQIADEHPGARIVVDMPATGHSVTWLRVAAQGRDLIGRGPLYDLCDRLTRELVHPGRASVVVVTLPERLVLLETLELCRQLAREVSLPPSRIVINRVPTALPKDALTDARKLAQASDALGQAAAALAETIELRSSIANEIEQAIFDTLDKTSNDHAKLFTKLPLSSTDPTSDVVAEWLLERGAA